MLEKYPALRSPAVINSASYLVVQLKDFAEQVCNFVWEFLKRFGGKL